MVAMKVARAYTSSSSPSGTMFGGSDRVVDVTSIAMSPATCIKLNERFI